MDKLFKMFFSYKGRIGQFWFFLMNTSILLPLAIVLPFLRIEHVGLLFMAIVSSAILLWIFFCVIIKRLKDSEGSYGWILLYFFPIAVYIHPDFLNLVSIPYWLKKWAWILLTLCANAFIGRKKTIPSENIHGDPFDFSWFDRAIKPQKKELQLLEEDLNGGKRNLSKMDFSKRILKHQNLSHAILIGTCFEHSDLENANFSEADVTEASFLGANLKNANFSNAKGLETANFAKAQLEGAVLDFDFVEAGVFGQIENLAKMAKPIFIGLLSACVYTWLAVAGIEDADLILDRKEATLPIIQIQISTTGFFYWTPVILIGIFLYFNMYLRRLWEEVRALPMKFQNGKDGFMKVYPWIVLSFSHVGEQGSSLFRRLERLLCILLVWWFVPFTIGVLWWNSLVKHDWFLSLMLMAGILLSALIAITFQMNSVELLVHKAFKKREYRLLGTVFTVVFGSILFLYSYNSIRGIENIPTHRANLETKDLSKRPANYWSSDPKTRHLDITGPTLDGCDLRFMKGREVFLVKASLINSDLGGADLRAAHFTAAKLMGANLEGANLIGVHLEGTDLSYANLNSVNLSYAHLEGTDLSYANLNSVNLSYAHLEGADLSYAHLEGAKLWRSDLEGADLRGAHLEGADLSYAHLDSAKLEGAHLEGANLEGAHLEGANLREAHLDSTDLYGVYLDSVKVSHKYWLDAILVENDMKEHLKEKYWVDTNAIIGKYGQESFLIKKKE